MSSFRPDTEIEAPAFIPFGFVELARSKVSSQKRGASDFAAGPFSETGPPAGQPLGVDAPNSEASPSPAQLETLLAFEQAAFERGVESARSADRRLSETCDRFEEAIAQLERSARTSVGANRELVLGLATEIARRWVGEELAIDPARFAAVLDRALEGWEGPGEIRLALHPEDLAQIEAKVPDRVASWNDSTAIELVRRSALERGAFEIEGGSMRLDGHPEAILASLRDALSVALEAPAPSGDPEAPAEPAPSEERAGSEDEEVPS